MSTVFVEGHDFQSYCKIHILKQENQHGIERVKSVQIKSIDFNKITEYVTNLTEPLDLASIDGAADGQDRGTKFLILGYCVHMLLISAGLLQNSAWIVRFSSDYHSQSVSKIEIKPAVANYIDYKLLEFQDMGNEERIAYVLNIRYECVLPELEDKKWTVVAVTMKDLIITNQSKFKICCKHKNTLFSRYRYPRAITTWDKKKKKYHVYDGYQQLACAPEIGKFLIVVGY